MGVTSPTELQDIERLGAARSAPFTVWLRIYWCLLHLPHLC